MPPGVKRTSVLVVEDDRALRELYRSTLRGAGFDVGAVEDGTDALRRMEDWTPDVVVLDLALPRLNGRDFLVELRSRRETRTVPIVVVTGTDAAGLDGKDFVRVLQKPVDPDLLINAVEDAARGLPASPEPT